MSKKRKKTHALNSEPKGFTGNGYLAGGLLTFFTWGFFFFWLWPQMLFKNDRGDIVAGWQYLWADWSAHFAYTSHFAYRSVSDWFTDHPLFAGADFTYPFVMNAISGILIKWSLDVIPAFIVPSVLATLLFLIFFYALAFQVVKSGIGAFLSITLFLTGGSLIFLWYFFPDSIPLLGLPVSHDAIIGWKNVIISELVPQRAFLLGLPVTLSIIYTLTKWDEKQFATTRVWQLMLLGIFSATLLTIHVHSYIATVIFCLVFFLLRPAYFKKMVIFGTSATIVSALIYGWMFYGDVSSSFFKFYPGWLANEAAKDVNVFLFWLANWGLFLPAAVFAAWRLKLLNHPLVITGFVIFLIGNLMLFQPWDWDNEKLLTWSYLMLSVPVGGYLAKLLLLKRVFSTCSAICLLVLLTAGGFTEMGFLVGYTQEKMLKLRPEDRKDAIRDGATFVMFTAEDLELARQFREISRPTDTVLTSDQVTHIINTNTGRRILLGYRGWMWTYGIEYSDREKDMLEMFSGNGLEKLLFDEYSVDYVVIGHEETNNFQANEAYFSEYYPLVLKNANYRIYKVE